MKYCKSCGAENVDENKFCFNCRCDGFSSSPVNAEAVPVSPAPANAAPVPAQAVPPFAPMPAPVPPPQYRIPPAKPKKPLGISDLFSILGFVASIVGMFTVSIILHPLAAVASIAAFAMKTRFKALAISGFVVAIIGGIVHTAISLYQNGYIPQWIVNGAFH